jgi:hypothetical protein
MRGDDSLLLTGPAVSAQPDGLIPPSHPAITGLDVQLLLLLLLLLLAGTGPHAVSSPAPLMHGLVLQYSPTAPQQVWLALVVVASKQAGFTHGDPSPAPNGHIPLALPWQLK